MIRILVTTHGQMAAGMIQSATMLIGEAEGVDYVSFLEGMDMEELEASYQEKLAMVNEENPCLVFCDILGGTPFNIVSKFSYKNPNIAVIYGVNLPILIEAITTREGGTFASYVEEIAGACTGSIGLSEL